MRTESVKSNYHHPTFSSLLRGYDFTGNIPRELQDTLGIGLKKSGIIPWYKKVEIGSSHGSNAFRLEFQNWFGRVIKTVYSTPAPAGLKTLDYDTFENFYKAAQTAANKDEIALVIK